MDSAAVGACSSDHCGGPEGPGGTDRTHHRCRDYLSFCDKKTTDNTSRFLFPPGLLLYCHFGVRGSRSKGLPGEVTASGLTNGWWGRREARWWRQVAGRDGQRWGHRRSGATACQSVGQGAWGVA
jgi:hypothetical protein